MKTQQTSLQQAVRLRNGNVTVVDTIDKQTSLFDFEVSE